jgi:hypothetical protein
VFRHWVQEDTGEWRAPRPTTVVAEWRGAERRVAKLPWRGPERRGGIDRRAAFV